MRMPSKRDSFHNQMVMRKLTSACAITKPHGTLTASRDSFLCLSLRFRCRFLGVEYIMVK
jgi:hypothetical protein